MPKNDSLSQLAYEAIYRRLLAGQIRPRQRVSENGIARELGMSRTPVREAIRRLTREGMLYQVPRSGTYVAQPDRRRIVEAYELRIYLEALAVAKAARSMPASDIAQLAQMVEQMRRAARAFRESGARVISGDLLHEFASADMQFHLLILRAADNRLLFRTVAEILMQKQTLTFRGREHDLRLLARVWLFHARIARAVRRRDPRAARYWMREHLRNSRRDALAAFDRQLSQLGAATSGPADLTGVVERLIQRVAHGENAGEQSLTAVPAVLEPENEQK
ncbi:MAG: GntR family transcriptional regulator [Thermoguttaceae bacterium]|jgi:DNA-binding GntR family transcriptional regulator|nr:GntR family transcriptional regulator [Thermoguttaceae bacterium]